MSRYLERALRQFETDSTEYGFAIRLQRLCREGSGCTWLARPAFWTAARALRHATLPVRRPGLRGDGPGLIGDAPLALAVDLGQDLGRHVAFRWSARAVLIHGYVLVHFQPGPGCISRRGAWGCVSTSSARSSRRAVAFWPGPLQGQSVRFLGRLHVVCAAGLGCIVHRAISRSLW